MSVYEAGMMVCFGISWPVAALKTYKCKCVHGKSIHFSMLILLGYVCGIAHKVLDDMDWVFWLYILNTLFLAVYNEHILLARGHVPVLSVSKQ